MIKFFKGVVEEGKRVVWPSKEQAVRHTLMVVGVVVVFTLVFALLDLGYNELIKIALEG